MENVKWTDIIKNSVALERVGKESIMLELIKKRKRNWLGHCLRRNFLLTDALEGMVNGKKISDDIQQLYGDTKRRDEKSVEWRMLRLQ